MANNPKPGHFCFYCDAQIDEPGACNRCTAQYGGPEYENTPELPPYSCHQCDADVKEPGLCSTCAYEHHHLQFYRQ